MQKCLLKNFAYNENHFADGVNPKEQHIRERERNKIYRKKKKREEKDKLREIILSREGIKSFIESKVGERYVGEGKKFVEPFKFYGKKK